MFLFRYLFLLPRGLQINAFCRTCNTTIIYRLEVTLKRLVAYDSLLVLQRVIKVNKLHQQAGQASEKPLY